MIIYVLFETPPQNLDKIKKIHNKQVLDILNSKNSITKFMKYKYVEVTKNINVDLKITWIDDNDFPKFKGYSMAILNSRSPGKIHLNINNWTRLRKHHHEDWIKHYGKKALPLYRIYVINHELGHVLGATHNDFKVLPSTKNCHLMEQQTFKTKRNCKPSFLPHKKTLKIISATRLKV